MSKLSKTAKASMVQAVSKAKVEWTPQNAIPEIRRSREARLFVGNMELVDVLLGEYDKLLGQRVTLAATAHEYALLEKYLTAGTEQDAFTVLGEAPAPVLPAWAFALRTKIDDVKTLTTISAQNRATITVLREGKQAAEGELARAAETIRQLTQERDEARAQLEQERDVRLLLSAENAKLAKETGDVVSSLAEADATILDAGQQR